MARNAERGAVLSLGQLWQLARAWYHDRLDPAFRGRTLDEAGEIFAAAGLEGPFWQPA